MQIKPLCQELYLNYVTLTLLPRREVEPSTLNAAAEVITVSLHLKTGNPITFFINKAMNVKQTKILYHNRDLTLQKICYLKNSFYSETIITLFFILESSVEEIKVPFTSF